VTNTSQAISRSKNWEAAGRPTPRNETIAVLGDRLRAGRTRIPVGSLGDVEQIVIARLNDTIDRLELLVLYDTEELDEALAELDRLHGEISD
jgi:hypothetical protein